MARVLNQSLSPRSNDEGALPLAQAANLPGLEVAVPESVYGAAVFIPQVVESDGFVDWIRWHGMQYFLLAMNLLIQAYFVRRIRSLYQDQIDTIFSGDCDKLDIKLLILCMIVFCMYIVNDLQESMYLFKLVWGFRSESGESELILFTKDDDGIQSCSGGLSSLACWAISILILLPKIAIALVLMMYGNYYLASSGSDGDVLLNSMALCFIVDIDELIYSCFMPCYTKRLVAAIPPLTRPEVEGFFKLWYGWGTFIKILLIAVCAFVCHFIPRCGSTEGFPGMSS